VTVAEWESDPLVPVTVTVTVPAAPKVQESVEVPEPPVTVAGVSMHALLSEASATLPVKPLTGEIVIMEVPAVPIVTLTVVGFAEIVKSGAPATVKSTVAV